jgi:hypothetical protein
MTTLMHVPNLNWLGEVAMVADGNDVVVKRLLTGSGQDRDVEGGVVATVAGTATGC